MGPVLDMVPHCLFPHTPDPSEPPQEFRAAFRERLPGASKSPHIAKKKNHTETCREVVTRSWRSPPSIISFPSFSLLNLALLLPPPPLLNDKRNRGRKGRKRDTRKGECRKRAHEERKRKEGERKLLKDNSIPKNNEILSFIEILDGLVDSFSNEGFYRSRCSLEQEGLPGQRPHLYSA